MEDCTSTTMGESLNAISQIVFASNGLSKFRSVHFSVLERAFRLCVDLGALHIYSVWLIVPDRFLQVQIS